MRTEYLKPIPEELLATVATLSDPALLLGPTVTVFYPNQFHQHRFSRWGRLIGDYAALIQKAEDSSKEFRDKSLANKQAKKELARKLATEKSRHKR